MVDSGIQRCIISATHRVGTIKNCFSSASVVMADDLCYGSHLRNHDWRKHVVLVLVIENAAEKVRSRLERIRS